MQRTLLLCLFVLTGPFIYGQQNVIDKYFKNHYDNPAFSKISVTEKTFNLVTELEVDTPEEQKVLDAIDNIEGILVLANEHTQISKEYYEEAVAKLVSDKTYEDLLIVEHQHTNIRFLIREDEEAIRELVAIIGEEDVFVLASIYGIIDLANLSNIMNILREDKKEWFDMFQNIDSEELVFEGDDKNQSSTLEKRAAVTSINDLRLRIFPNPATELINISTTDNVTTEMEVTFYSLEGREIRKIGKVPLPYQVRLAELPAGAYFLRLTDSEGVFKNFRIVKPSTLSNN